MYIHNNTPLICCSEAFLSTHLANARAGMTVAVPPRQIADFFMSL